MLKLIWDALRGVEYRYTEGPVRKALILLAIVGYVVNTAFLAVERRLLRWHEGAHGRAEAM